MSTQTLADVLLVETTDGRTRSDLVAAASSAMVRSRVLGASTVDLTVEDPDGSLATSTARPLTTPSTLTMGGRNFSLASVARTGTTLRLVFEDALVAACRAVTAPVSLQPGQSVAAVARMLASDAGVPIVVDPDGEHTVLQVNAGRSWAGVTTSSWQEMSSIAADLGWRCFSDGAQIALGADAWLLTRGTPVSVIPELDPVHDIDFTIDPGQPFARAELVVDTGSWSADAGAVVDVTGAGPADGLWLVSSWPRQLLDDGTSRVRVSRSSTPF